MGFLSDIIDGASRDEFEERPVDIVEFVTSPYFLGLQGLSEYQYALVDAMTQIYTYETLVRLYGIEKKAYDRHRQTCKEVIMQLGKGSGKDFTSTVAVAYVVYLLLCLKDPATYYGNTKGDSIDIINIAINADQAQRVFFKNFIEKIKNCPWFEGKYEDKKGEVAFDKNVTVYSGHSEREAFEGYNTFIVILDEISGFAMATDEDAENAKTSAAIYKMYKASVTSRFPEYGKLVLLSFPRFEEDFIQQKYNQAIGEKEVVIRSAVVYQDPDLPEGTPGNELLVEWEEDHIIRYARPKVFALRRPSWEVRPGRNIQMYADDFFLDIGDALGRFACMPSNITGGFFKNMDKVKAAFSRSNGVDEDGIFRYDFSPKEDTMYFMHVDLAQKHDHCAVGMAHVDKWIQYQVGTSEQFDYLPLVNVDAIRWWTPSKTKSVDFKDVVEYVKAVRRRGFNLKLVTFDRWNSHDTINDLKANGIESEVLSVAKKHYDDFLITCYDDRLLGPHEELLIKEMGELVEKKGKVDHPRKGSKDLADAVCGAIFNAVALTPREVNNVMDVYTLEDLREMTRVQRQPVAPENDRVIRISKKEAPDEIQALLNLARII